MRRASGLTAVAATCLLAATACGGGPTNVAQTFKPGGSSVASRTAGSSTSPSGQSRRNGLSVQLKFATPLPANATQRKIVLAFRHEERVLMTSMAHPSNYDVVKVTTRDFQRRMIKKLPYLHKYEYRGIRTFFATRVASVYNGRGAALRTCVDDTHFHTYNRKTGKNEHGFKSGDHYLLQIALSLTNGEWLVGDSVYFNKGSKAKECLS